MSVLIILINWLQNVEVFSVLLSENIVGHSLMLYDIDFLLHMTILISIQHNISI